MSVYKLSHTVLRTKSRQPFRNLGMVKSEFLRWYPDCFWLYTLCKGYRLAVVTYKVLVNSLFSRVPHTSNYCHNKQRVVLVLEFVLVFWHQKNDKNVRQSDNMLACVAGVRRGRKGERRTFSLPCSFWLSSLPFYGLPRRLTVCGMRKYCKFDNV